VTDIFKILAESIVYPAMKIPQSVLDILANSKLEVLEYGVLACGTISCEVRYVISGEYRTYTEPRSVVYSGTWGLSPSDRLANWSPLAAFACLL